MKKNRPVPADPAVASSVASGPALERSALTRESLFELGASLRKAAPRRSHAGYTPKHGRPDPVDVLVRSSEGRIPELLPIRYGRMRQTPFTFFRGAAAVMALDLAGTPSSGVTLQACGDCHLLNFGGFGTPERRVIFDINDFDETSLAPWEWDLKRLAASFVIAARENGLREAEARETAVAAAGAYRTRMAELAGMPALHAWYTFTDYQSLIDSERRGSVRRVLKKTFRKAVRKSSVEGEQQEFERDAAGVARIKDNPPLVYHPDGQADAEHHRRVLRIFERYRETLPYERRALFDRYRLADVARKVVGIGSVGTDCWIALFFATEDDPLILQVKEARESVLEPFTKPSAFGNRGERVVEGQRLMQTASDIFLGWTESDDGRHYYVRQLHDVKIKPIVEEMKDLISLTEHAVDCGKALARAHARSGSAAVLAGYMGRSDLVDEAIADFAVAYADQNEQDHAALLEAIRSGRIDATDEA